jgi:hypothetical protein
MKMQSRKRLERLEAQIGQINEFDLRSYEYKSALISIVGFHVGKLIAGGGREPNTASNADLTRSSRYRLSGG